MTKPYKCVIFFAIISLVALSASSQTKTRKPVKKGTKTAVTVPQATPSSDPKIPEPAKKNERPTDGQQSTPIAEDPGSKDTAKNTATDPAYFYEFSQPNFTITKITIVHDESGKGKLTFVKGIYDEPIVEPLQLSKVSLDKINAALTELDFLNSTASYQYEKDYSHLGNVIFRLKKDGRERETRFNYTQNKGAKALADEYRKIGNQIIWMFDITVARENQPLEAPRLMDAFQSYMDRGEISDPKQMVPFLQGLTDDERIPLIARNHAGKLVKQIEKPKK